MITKKLFVFLFLMLFLFSGFVYAESNTEIIREDEMKVFAVSPSKISMTATLNINIIDGDGKIYSSINEDVGHSTLESERNAVSVAEMVVPEAKDKYNYLFHIDSPATSIDGPSAGAAMAFLIINMLEGEETKDLSITGTISPGGYVGDVSGIYEKAEKAAEEGIELFMMPKGNKNQIIETNNGESKLVDIVEYAYNTWGLKIIEVSTIDEIIKYGRMPIEEIDVFSIETTDVTEFIPEAIEYSQALKPMREIVDVYYETANDLITSVEEKLSTVTITDISAMQNMLYLTERAKKQINDAEIYSNANYLYTSANSAFIGLIYARTVDKIIQNPSILIEESSIFEVMLKELQKDIQETEERTKDCSLNNMEWCIGAKQRVVWANNQLDSLDGNPGSIVSKVMDYSYAYAWNEIANDFLDVGNVEDEIPFIEHDYFEKMAQNYIIEIEDKLVTSPQSIVQDVDLNRRFAAAKISLRKGWYVTSIYDSATVLAIIEGREASINEQITIENFKAEYDALTKKLKTEEQLLKTTNVWSKLFFDHADYFYRSYDFYENNRAVQQNNLRTAYNIVLFSKYLYGAEKEILAVYENIEIKDFDKYNGYEDLDDNDVVSGYRPIYVYQRTDDTQPISKRDTTLYVLLIAVFLCIVAIVWDLEKIKNKKTRLLLQISDLEDKLIDKKITQKTYAEMRAGLLEELKEMKDRRHRRKKESLFYEEKVTLKPSTKKVTPKPSRKKATKK